MSQLTNTIAVIRRFLLRSVSVMFPAAVFVLIPVMHSESNPNDSPGQTIEAPHPSYPISYSDGFLQVMRDREELEMTEDSLIVPGDVIETRPRQFAIINFPPGGMMIVYPSSVVEFASDSGSLELQNAGIDFEMDLTGSSFPEKIRCYDGTLTHNVEPGQTASYGIQCRGEPGIIITTQAGKLNWELFNKKHEIPQGNGLLCRATSPDWSNVPMPEQPKMIDTNNIKNRQSSDETVQARFQWQPIRMVDHYLVHIYGNDPYKDHVKLLFHHDNHFTVRDMDPGSYYFRVKAVDYYGVPGFWSDPFEFDI